LIFVHCKGAKFALSFARFKLITFCSFYLAWVEGTAILVAVFLVAGVGSFVDWRKEIAFVAVKIK
jgi:hypothetical protein